MQGEESKHSRLSRSRRVLRTNNAGRMLTARDETLPDRENEYPPGEQE